jgi:hypothetical protein
LGNHDSTDLISILENIGFKVLLNESIFLNIEGLNLALTGIDDTSHFYTRNSLRCAIDSPSYFRIIAAHTPELADFYSKMGYDLYICGHTHGGQINIFKNLPLFTGIIRNKKLFNGSWRINQMNGFTSSGVGASLLPIRINVPSEITLHTVNINFND